MDLDESTWTIPGEQMKNGNVYTVPLPKQAIELLLKAKTWKALDSHVVSVAIENLTYEQAYSACAPLT